MPRDQVVPIRVKSSAAGAATAAKLQYMADKSTAMRANAKQARDAFLAKARRSDNGLRRPQLASQVPRGFRGPTGEAKYKDIANSAYALDTTGSITHMSAIAQGTTVNQRVGRSCELKYFQMRGHVQNNGSATFNDWAVYLVWDEQPNKVLAGITDVLDAATAYSLSKRENVQRFKILKKWTGCLSGNSTTPACDVAVRLDEYVRLPKGLVIVPTTADTTGEIGNVITGALLLVTVGISAAGASAAQLAVTCRVGFADI